MTKPYILNTIPHNGHEWQRREAMAMRAKIETHAHVVDGVLRWWSNGRCVPESCFRDACATPNALQVETTRREDREAIAAYKAAQEGRYPTFGEMSEMRAAFGAGAKVVNVLTGREVQL